MPTMKKTIIALSLLLAGATAFAQSTARKFMLKNSADGQSEITVYLPHADKANGKAVVDCPGGGYSHLSMENEGHNWAEFYNGQGIAYVVLKYRMPNGDRNIPLGDAYNAIKTVRDSASVWNINPNAVGIQGFSAGGHLASAVSTHAPFAVRPNFSVLFYPVISMDERLTHKGSCVGFLGDLRSDAKMVNEWSSDKAVRRHLTPPAIIITANDDRVVHPVNNGIAYYSAMRRAGNDCSLVVYPTGGHGFGFRDTYKYHDQMVSDLTNWLSNLSLPAATDKKIACIGNSITDGHGIDMCDQLGYPALLGGIMGKGYAVKNFGVSARTAVNNGDHPYQQELAWKDCLAWQPDVVVIKLGTNDTKPGNRVNLVENYTAAMQQMIDSLRALPSNPRIYLATPIPAFKSTWDINDSVIVNEVIPTIKTLARNNMCEIIDLHTLFADGGKLMQSDGIHPDMKGVAKIAELVDEALKAEPVYPAYDPNKKNKKKNFRTVAPKRKQK